MLTITHVSLSTPEIQHHFTQLICKPHTLNSEIRRSRNRDAMQLASTHCTSTVHSIMESTFQCIFLLDSEVNCTACCNHDTSNQCWAVAGGYIAAALISNYAATPVPEHSICRCASNECQAQSLSARPDCKDQGH